MKLRCTTPVCLRECSQAPQVGALPTAVTTPKCCTHRNSCSRSMKALMLAGVASTSNSVTMISLLGCSSTDRLDTCAT